MRGLWKLRETDHSADLYFFMCYPGWSVVSFIYSFVFVYIRKVMGFEGNDNY